MTKLKLVLKRGNNKIIKIHIIGNVKKPTTVVIFFHGAYGTTLTNKYNLIANKINKQKAICCILFESSRELSYNTCSKGKISFEDYKKSMVSKVFNDELDDAKAVVQYVQEKWKNISSKLKVHFVGISLGGYIASLLTSIIGSKLRSLTLLGCGKTKEINKKGVFFNMPTFQDLIDKLSQFTGVLTVIHGSSDDLISWKSSHVLFNKINKTATKQYFLFNEVDHRFRTINNKPQEKELATLLGETISHAIILGELKQEGD